MNACRKAFGAFSVVRASYKFHANIPRYCTSATRQNSTGLPAFNDITTETVGEKSNIALITLNSPKTLNALCDKLMSEVGEAVRQFDSDPTISCLILTGKGKAFAAGADIKEMTPLQLKDVYMAGADIKEMTPLQLKDVYMGNFLSHWDALATCTKPVIAAVNGFALGGGCEIAMMCDIIYAGERAKFGQPEIKLGTLPGAGGTQRLTKAVGKSRAMELILTGDFIDAKEAASIGLVSKVVPDTELLPECIKLAEKIGQHSKMACAMAKEAVNKSFELSLREGLHFEKRIFHMSFATNDRAEGMAAFSEKRDAKFTDS